MPYRRARSCGPIELWRGRPVGARPPSTAPAKGAHHRPGMAAPSHIYVSYRRTDGDYAGRLHDQIADYFGRERVLIDIGGIEPGADWAEKLRQLVESASAVLAVIGPHWADLDGRRRLNDSSDFVRHELATALGCSTPVVPVLVGGARPPSANELPPELEPLVRLHAVEIDDRDWTSGVEGVIATLERRKVGR